MSATSTSSSAERPRHQQGHSRRFVAAATALALAAIVIGCRSTGDKPVEERSFQRSLVAVDENGAFAALVQRQPADIYVTPVIDQTDAFAAPIVELRGALYTGLVDRLYTPVRLAWADEQITGMGGDGAPTLVEANAAIEADAFLEVRLLAWDETGLERDGLVFARVEARLVDPSQPDEPLWGFLLAREISVGGPSSRRATRDVLVGQVAKELSRELLQRLPARDARLAPR